MIDNRSFKIGPSQYGQMRHRNRVLLISLGLASVLFLSLALRLAFGGEIGGASVAQAVAKEPIVTNETQKLVAVLVPASRIPAGTPLEPAMFKVEQRPKVAVAPRTAGSFEELRGQYAKALIPPGMPLSLDYLTSVRPSSAVTAQIPVGFRAVTISVDARSAVEGWARPGARVDVAWSSSINGEAGVTVIVQNALVLSAERHTQTDNDIGAPTPSTVSLIVSEGDANKIHLASTTGRITLSLRGDTDAKGISGNSITVRDLLRGGEPRENRGPQIEGTVSVRGFDGNNESYALVDGRLVKSGRM